jgi:hypothetical protein
LNFFLLFFFKGINLLSTHSIDLINIRIDNINNACIPFNLTNTSLMCLVSKLTINTIKEPEANVEVINKKKNEFSMKFFQLYLDSNRYKFNIFNR